MGKKSRERMTGKTYEDRTMHPIGYKHKDVLKEEKNLRQEQKLQGIFAQIMSASVRVGKTKD